MKTPFKYVNVYIVILIVLLKVTHFNIIHDPPAQDSFAAVIMQIPLKWDS